MSNQASPEEDHESNGNSSSPGAVSTAVNSLEETEFTCHIYDGSEGAIRLPEPKAKPAFRKKEEVVVEDTKDSISSVNTVFRRMRVALTGKDLVIKFETCSEGHISTSTRCSLNLNRSAESAVKND